MTENCREELFKLAQFISQHCHDDSVTKSAAIMIKYKKHSYKWSDIFPLRHIITTLSGANLQPTFRDSNIVSASRYGSSGGKAIVGGNMEGASSPDYEILQELHSKQEKLRDQLALLKREKENQKKEYESRIKDLKENNDRLERIALGYETRGRGNSLADLQSQCRVLQNENGELKNIVDELERDLQISKRGYSELKQELSNVLEQNTRLKNEIQSGRSSPQTPLHYRDHHSVHYHSHSHKGRETDQFNKGQSVTLTPKEKHVLKSEIRVIDHEITAIRNKIKEELHKLDR